MALFIYMNIKRIIQEEINDFDWTELAHMDNYNGIHFMYSGNRYHIVDNGGDNVLLFDDDGVLFSLHENPFGFRTTPRDMVDRMFNSDSFVITQGD